MILKVDLLGILVSALASASTGM